MSPNKELEDFFTYFYGEVDGYAYSPVKNPETQDFEQYFFHWPEDRSALVEHVQRHTTDHEVYFSPGLFKTADAGQDNFKGTYFVWAEFDGNLPDNLEGIPQPSIKVRSSTEDHEHWYWRLDHFERERAKVEDISQRLAYHLNADIGCWNANRVLRPPGTKHHESKRTTSTLRWDTRPYAIDSFKGLPDLPIKLIHENDIGAIPQALDVISNYLFDDEFLPLLRATVLSKKEWEALDEDKRAGKGKDRNAALTKLAHFCVEAEGRNGKKMNDAEILAVLWNADERWKKFHKRKDRKTRLLAIVNHVRSRHPAVPLEDAPASEHLKVYNFEEFMNTELRLEWVIEGLVHRKGFVIISGPPDVGKSQISIRFAERLAKGEPFLKWTPSRPMKILIVSMEMPHEELQYIMEQMQIPSNDLLRENLLIMPLGYSLKLTNTTSQVEFATLMDTYKPDGVIFDSLGVGLGEDLSSDKIVFQTFDYINKIVRNHFGAFVWFIHHNRKGQIGNKKPNRLEDLFGSAFIGAQITTGIGLWPEPPNIEVNCLKLRMAKKFNPFIIRRQPGLDFAVVEGTKTVTSAADIQVFGDGSDDLSDSI